MNEVHRAASTLSHILNPSRSRGALEQRESPPPPSTLIHRRRCHRPRLRRHVHDASALLVAAFERISINEPVMAGPSSSAGTEGPQSRSSLFFLCVIVVDLGFRCTQIKEIEKSYSIRTLCDPSSLTPRPYICFHLQIHYQENA